MRTGNSVGGLTRLAAVAAVVALAGCEAGPPAGPTMEQQSLANQGKLDVRLKVLLAKNPAPNRAKAAMPAGLVATKVANIGGVNQILVDVFIQASAKVLPQLQQLGVETHTVTKSGIITATVPLNKLTAVAALADVQRIEAGRQMRLYNDISNSVPAPGCTASACVGMNNLRTEDGSGVIVGVIDSGLDWTHEDFIDENGSRILAYWDQSDPDNSWLQPDGTVSGPPTGFTYGTEYSKADIDLALNETGWIDPQAEDEEGHGTHVTGTAAGNGRGSGLMGAAPKAGIVFVKFDFDNDADRNTDTAIIDGISYIFQKAAALGLPAVINMSLGSDFGPHDGSTMEERGIDDLTGPGRLVVVAAGNPGNNNWGSLGWGFAMHGQGTLGDDTVMTLSPYTPDPADDDYVFFDLWYPTGNKCRVMVTSPSGAVYPASTSGRNKALWVTGGFAGTYNTPEGAIYVGNGGDQLSWDSTTSDEEAYIEISDSYGTAPAVGAWTISLVPADAKSTCSGTYHTWFGASTSLIHGWRDDPSRVAPTFGGKESDNAYTIGSPASATSAIAVAAYQSRNCWSYADYTDGDTCLDSPLDPAPTQCYGAEPITYYDPFAAGELAYFSARGPRRDGVLKPEIATPGVGIASSFAHTVRDRQFPHRCDSVYNYEENYHYFYHRVLPNLEATVIQGTSMACPNATGALALALEKKVDMTPDCVRAVLQLSALHDAVTDVPENVPYTAKTDTDMTAAPGQPNADWGYGKMDIAATLAVLDGPLPAACQAAPSGCSVDSDCGDGEICCGESCVLPVCNVDSDCAEGEICQSQGSCDAACVISGGNCLAAGASCSSGDDCCSGKCLGKPGKQACK